MIQGVVDARSYFGKAVTLLSAQQGRLHEPAPSEFPAISR
jgi:hypothetical protein